MRLVWGHICNLAFRRYNIFRYTFANVDDSSVRPLIIFGLAITQREQVARGRNRSIPRLRFAAPAPLSG